MSNSSLVTKNIPANSNNYSVGRNGKKIEMITIHHMAGVLSATECGKLFQDENRKASSHYGIGKDGEIGQYVDESNTAYTNGNFDSNQRSVTIETSNSQVGGSYPISDKVLKVLINLIADIAKRNNLGTLVKRKNLTWHKMYTATACPGEYLLSKMDYIVEEANKINNKQTNTLETSGKKTNEEIANEVIKGLWGNGEERKQKLVQAGYDYSEIQKIVNQKLGINSTNKKTNEEIANEVIKGLWGNGEERKQKLAQAGYNYSDIQKIVNAKLK